MSQENDDSKIGLDEDGLLSVIEEYIPDIFLGDYPHHRTRQTIAILDYIQYLKDGQPCTPSFHDIAGSDSRSHALTALKKIIPDKCFRTIGIDGGKNCMSAGRDRIQLLLAAQAYLAELMPQENRRVMSILADDDPPVLCDTKQPISALPWVEEEKDSLIVPVPATTLAFAPAPAPASDTTLTAPIDRLMRDAGNIKATVEAQNRELILLRNQVQELLKDKVALGHTLKKQDHDIELLKSMMITAGIGRNVVENALTLVREGKSLQDVVAEILEKAFHPRTQR